MTDERRRVGGSAPTPVEPDPGDTLPYAPTITPPQLPYAPTITPPQLPYAPTMTPPQLAGSTLDMRGSAKRSEPPGGGGATLDLPASDQVDPAGTLDPGQMIGHFVIKHRLGEGGMGIVVAGHDADLGRPVAIKLVKAEVDHPAYRARLLREAQAMARLEHPNVVRVYEVGSDRGRLFVAMELVDGVTLSVWLRVQRRPWRDIVAMFAQVGAGLSAVHRAGLVHRDFKPDNVLVDRDGRARVADFGLTRLENKQSASPASPELAASLTRTGMLMGTPGYMAPEQQFGSGVDARADQYSYCVALREALLGGRPEKIQEANWGDVPRAVRAVIARGLSYDPRERFASMDELLAALRSVETRRATRISVVVAVVAISGGIATAAIVMNARGGSPTPTAPVEAAGAGSGSAPLVAPPPLPDAGVVAMVHVPSDAQEVRAEARDRGTVDRPDLSLEPPRVPKNPAPPLVDAGVNLDETRNAVLRGLGTTPWGPGSAAPPAGSSAPTRAARRPEAWPSDPGHLAIVRATIQNLGYDGLDPGLTATEVDKLAGPDQVIGKVKLAMLERRKGRCAAANVLFSEARQALHPTEGEQAKWHARAAMGQALCALADGKPDAAHEHQQHAWVHGNQDESRLVLAIIFYEKGEMPTAQGLFIVASRLPNPTVRAAVQIWLDRTGLTLMP